MTERARAATVLVSGILSNSSTEFNELEVIACLRACVLDRKKAFKLLARGRRLEEWSLEEFVLEF
jgi:hypothetical protein